MTVLSYLDLITLTFKVAGRPTPQGSKRAIVNHYTGKPALVESSKKHLVPWRAAVTSAAQQAIGEWESRNRARWARLTGPVTVTVIVRYWRPKSHYGTGRNSTVLKENAPLAPSTKHYGDSEKHARAVKDALTDAGVWWDDAQDCDLTVKKRWAMPPDYPAGAVVTVRAWEVQADA